jgi:hypothetical protein
VSQKVDQALENSLQASLRARFGERFIAQNWRARNFAFYTDNVDLPKMDVLEATESVAATLILKLSDETARILQRRVSLNSTPNDVLPHMSAALDVAEPAIAV